MNKKEIIRSIISHYDVTHKTAEVFAPVNIALIKYWGKRDTLLNLPNTSSLSITLPNLGSHTRLEVIHESNDRIFLNNERIAADSEFYQKLIAFIDLFRIGDERFLITTHNNIPTAAGLASSASGFAAIIKALNEIYAWDLPLKDLSQLARLGSGSACRSFWHGFVLWDKGFKADGSDSYGLPLTVNHEAFSALRVGVLILQKKPKKISSRIAMKQTVESSPFYTSWPALVQDHLTKLLTAIDQNDLNTLGFISEQNAIAMHATMHTAVPGISYHQPETWASIQKVWALRDKGIPVYFTQDAGPNIKLLFDAAFEDEVVACFPEVQVLSVFGSP